MSQRLAEYQIEEMRQRQERVACLEESESVNKHSGPTATRSLLFGFICNFGVEIDISLVNAWRLISFKLFLPTGSASRAIFLIDKVPVKLLDLIKLM